MRVVMAAVWLAAALSGGAALAYEVCWSRALVVPLGNSTDAAALVLAGFMLGIGLGAYAGGVVAERVRAPLRLYAVLEAVLGLYAFIAPVLLGALSTFSGFVNGLPPSLGILARWAAALVLITLPGLAMGASLPLLVRALTGAAASLRRRIGITYGANTIGAAAGAVLTGFWGIPAVGLRACSWAAAIASLAAALLGLLASYASRGAVAAPQTPAEAGSVEKAQRRLERVALAAAFVSGLVMLACELLWARVLTFVFGHDTYAFASLLALVLLGLALGGFAHRLVAHVEQATLLTGLLGVFALSLLGSYWGALSLVVARGRDPFGLEASGSFAASLWLEFFRELSYTPLLVLAPSMVAGAIFATACAVFCGAAPDTGRRVGVVGLVNGVGSAAGAVLSVWALVPVAGIQGGFVLMALLSAAASCAAQLAYQAGQSARRAATANETGSRRWTVALAPLGATALVAAAMPRDLPRQMLLEVVGPRHQALLHYDEARTGTVSVIENHINGERQLLMNAVNEVTTRLVHDQSFKLLGHLAPLLHPKPRKGVMICLGAGLSAGSAVTHPLERLDVIDLSAAVARGARYFTAQNNGVLDDPAFHLHIGDGRQFLLNTATRYDVAIVDSTHPKAVDSWILYTKEFYELVRDRLGPAGIAVQWLPLHGLSEQEFKLIVRTFLTAFPSMTLWANVGFETYGQVGYAKLVGVKNGALSVNYDELSRRLEAPEVHRDLAPFGMTSADEILDLFVAPADAVRRWTEGLPSQTDEHPLVPYTTRFSVGRRMEPRLLLAVRSRVTPLLRGNGAKSPAVRERLDRAFEAQGWVLAGRLDQAEMVRPDGGKIRLFVEQARSTRPYYEAMSDLYRDDPARLFEAATQLAGLGHPVEARRIYTSLLRIRPDDYRARINLALLLLDVGQADRAIEQLALLRDKRPRSALVHYNLGAAVLASGDASAAARHLEEALAWDPDSLGAKLALGRAYLEAGQLERAEARLEELLQENPWVAEARLNLGLAFRVGGRTSEALRAFCQAHRLDPSLERAAIELAALGGEGECE